MTDTPAVPESQQPRVTNEDVLDGDKPTNWYLVTLWLIAILSGILAVVMLIVGAVATNPDDAGVPTDALGATWAFQVATGLLATFGVTISAALAIGAVRWQPKV